MTEEQPNFQRRVPELDGLRGIAILLVIACHYIIAGSAQVTSNTVSSYLLVLNRLTWSGVDLFFVLSGFLIGGILLDVRTSPNYFKAFYIRRFYRILLILGHEPRFVGLPSIAVSLLSLILTLVIAKASWIYFEKQLVKQGHQYSYEEKSVLAYNPKMKYKSP